MVAKSSTSIMTDFQELRSLSQYYKANNITCACVSGGFDPIHSGHLDLILSASILADELVVFVNDDNFLLRKKGYVFLPQDERLKLVLSLKGVSQAFIYSDSTQDVCKGIEALKPNFFVNGGDRQSHNCSKEEIAIAAHVGTELIYLNGPKVNSSSTICDNLYKQYLKKRFREC